MRALVVHEFGPVDSHRIEDFPSPEPGPNDVIVNVQGIGLNFADALMLQGKYQMRPAQPFVPGRDAAGVVARVGENVTRVKVGDRVICQVLWGAFAEEVRAPQEKVFKLPDELDLITAAGSVTVYNTAYVAVFERGAVQDGETVFITGASGGVGLAMVELAHARGATVLAGATSKAKGDLAIAHGADHWVDLGVDDLHEGVRDQVAELTNGELCAAVLDVVGGKVFDAAMRCVGYRGRMVIVGFASNEISMPKGHHILLKNISVIGAPLDINFKQSIDVIQRGNEVIFDLWKTGRINPNLAGTVPFEEIVVIERSGLFQVPTRAKGAAFAP